MDTETGPTQRVCGSCRVLVIWDDETGVCIHCKGSLNDANGQPYAVRLKTDQRRTMTLMED
jgi:hypothetical protein